MKAFIFDPLWKELITDELQSQLDQANIELIITTDIAPIKENTALFE